MTVTTADVVHWADVQPMIRESERVAVAEAASGTAMRIRVPAKLNLFLAVRGSRFDGFHELVTVFQTVSVYDELRVALVGQPGRRHHPAGRRRMRLELWADAVTTWRSVRRCGSASSVASAQWRVPTIATRYARSSIWTSASRSRPAWPVVRQTPRRH